MPEIGNTTTNLQCLLDYFTSFPEDVMKRTFLLDYTAVPLTYVNMYTFAQCIQRETFEGFPPACQRLMVRMLAKTLSNSRRGVGPSSWRRTCKC